MYCKCLGLEEWKRGGGGMLLNYRWSEVRLLNLYTVYLFSLIAECTPLVLINGRNPPELFLIKHHKVC